MKILKISQATLDAISASELAAQNAGLAGVKAIITLLEDYDIRPAKHGDAKTLSDLLKAAGVKPAACKRYAELTVMASATVHHRAIVARSKVKAVDKAEAEKASVLTDMAKLSSMASMAKVRQWAQENGPKADKADKAKTDAQTDAQTDIIQGAPVANDPAQEKAMALEGYRTALKAALKAGISPDTLKALILAEGKATSAKTQIA